MNEKKTYRFCRVKFRLDAAKHTYRADGLSVRPGDFVSVQREKGGRPVSARVLSVGDYGEEVIPASLDTPAVLGILTAEEAEKVDRLAEWHARQNDYRTAPRPDGKKGKKVPPIRTRWGKTVMAVAVLIALVLCAYLLIQEDRRKYYVPGYSRQQVKEVLEKAQNYTPPPTARPTQRPTSRPVVTPRPTRRPSSSSAAKNSDPYDAKSYAHPDDFYYEYRDDFIDYEEAEEYWERYSG